MHCAKDILLCRLAHRVLLIVRQNHHVFSRVAEVAVQVGGHVFDIIDAAAQLAFLVEVIDADEEGFAATGTGGVLEAVGGRSAGAEGLHLLRGWRRGVMISLDIGIRIHSGEP